MKNYQPGQLIRVRGVNNRRLVASLVLCCAIAFGLARTGTSTITHIDSNDCGNGGNVKMPKPGAGGGTIKGGSTPW